MRTATVLPIVAAFAAPAIAQDSTASWAVPNSAVTGPRVSTLETVTNLFRAKDWFRSAPTPDRERLIALNEAGDGQAIYDFLFARAQEQKVWAMLELGLAYARGSILEQDAATSLNWFAEAARRGNPEAALIMGVAYSAGDILVPNAEKARDWFALASENGDYRIKEDAKKYLASL